MYIRIIVLLLIAGGAYAQPVQYLGTPIRVTDNRGYLMSDSGLKAFTVGDTISATYLGGPDRIGDARLKSDVPYVRTSTAWTKLATGSPIMPSDTAAMLLPYAHKIGDNATGTWPISITGSAPTLTTARTIGTVTGDATSAGSAFNGSANNTNALTLATVNTNVGTFGSATQSAILTANGKGLITGVSNATITPAVGSITGLGTGVATALGVNISTAGSFVVNGGALGTPSSGTATNLTGTASGLTAGTVTTNANLTGPITSLGNATSIASQTGTGTTFAMSVGPTITGTLISSNTTDVTLGAQSAMMVGGATNSTNLSIGEYSTGTGLQSRNNGSIGALFINPLGGDVSMALNGPSGVHNILGYHTGGGTGDYVEFGLRNASLAADGTFMRTMGTAWTTSGMNVQDGGVMATGGNLSGGMSVGTQAGDLRLYSANVLRTTLDANGHTLMTNRLEMTQATIASANDLTLTTGNQFLISGTTQITAIISTSWQAGSVVSLQFQGSLTVKNNTAGGAGTAVIRLSGAVDWGATALDTITLKFDGTQWVELGRSVN